MTSATVDVRPFEPRHARDVARLATAVQWPSLTDPAVVEQVCTAPGAVSCVAVLEEPGPGGPGDRVVGWSQALTDGVLQCHLSFLAVHPDHRRHGIGRLLVVATFQHTGAKRMDLITDAEGGAEGFYESFEHRAMAGYRLYPGA